MRTQDTRTGVKGHPRLLDYMCYIALRIGKGVIGFYLVLLVVVFRYVGGCTSNSGTPEPVVFHGPIVPKCFLKGRRRRRFRRRSFRRCTHPVVHVRVFKGQIVPKCFLKERRRRSFRRRSFRRRSQIVPSLVREMMRRSFRLHCPHAARRRSARQPSLRSLRHRRSDRE